jgi:ankyrin repeat protein
MKAQRFAITLSVIFFLGKVLGQESGDASFNYAPYRSPSQAFDLSEYEGKWLSEIKGPAKISDTRDTRIGLKPMYVFKIRVPDEMKGWELFKEVRVLNGPSDSIQAWWFCERDWDKTVGPTGIIGGPLGYSDVRDQSYMYIATSYRGEPLSTVVIFDMRWSLRKIQTRPRASAPMDAPSIQQQQQTPGEQQRPEQIGQQGLENNGGTSLIVAAMNGDKDAVELLLAKGVEVDAKDTDGSTSLHRAAAFARKDVAELLLAKGADVNAKSYYGNTPLHDAVMRGQKDMAELLLAKGADVNAKGNSGFTPLHYAPDKDMAELLLAKGADVNATISDGTTPLKSAALRGNKDVAELLLAKGADVNAKGNSGYTPLHEAVGGGHKDMVELLLAKGADVNAKAKDGTTPLKLAAERRNNDIAELLRQHGGQE